MRADDRASGDAREHLDPAEDVELGELRQDADVEERGAKAAARERQPDLPDARRERGLGCGVAEEVGDEARGLAGRVCVSVERPETPRRICASVASCRIVASNCHGSTSHRLARSRLSFAATKSPRPKCASASVAWNHHSLSSFSLPGLPGSDGSASTILRRIRSASACRGSSASGSAPASSASWASSAASRSSRNAALIAV